MNAPLSSVSRFDGRTALVTGGGSGIGRAIALAFAREGAAVVVAGRNAATLESTVKLIEEEGGRAAAVTADVTSRSDLARLVATTAERFGGLHAAVNNAGMLTATGPVGEIDVEQWRQLLDVNVTGVLLAMREQIAHMRQHGGGTIVNISSSFGAHVRSPGVGAYSASKAAVTALSMTAALEYIGEGVRINVLSPGAVSAPMSLNPGESDQERDERIGQLLPAGRVGRAEEIAAAALYLSSPESGFAVGTDLLIDGGVAAG